MELLAYFFVAVPFLLGLLTLLAIIAFGGLSLSRPWLPVLAYLSVFFTFSGSTYGLLQGSGQTVYSRGTGQVLFPLLLWALLVGVGWTWMGRQFSGHHEPLKSPLLAAFGLWWLLLVGHMTWGLVSGIEFRQALGFHGFSLVPWMGVLVLMLAWSVRSWGDVRLMARCLVLAVLLKSVYGLVRWAFFGGDPANIYQNVEKISVKLTYFDIGDSLIGVMGLAASVVLWLSRPPQDEGRQWRVLYAVTAGLATACIFLSYRRTAWVGLGLALAYLVMRMPRVLRWRVIVFGLPAFALALAYVARQRLGNIKGASGLNALIYDLTSARFGAMSSRVLELQLALEEFARSPIVGIGAWGKFANTRLIAWQAGVDAGSFLHSGVLHIAMKTGLVGLLLMAFVVVAFATQVAKLRIELPPHAQALVIAAVAGMLFMVPDMLLGTPIPQLRTTQLIALCLGLPLMIGMVFRIESRKNANV